jgi:hypothetical protein
MSVRHAVAAVLLKAYPFAWRMEYGAELTDLLAARPLTPFVIADVIWSGLRQRVRAADPSTLLGVSSMLAVVGGYILTPSRYDETWTAFVRPASMTVPAFTVTFIASEVYAVLLLGCGCWTHLRSGTTPNQSGIAAMRMSLIAGIPVVAGGLLLAAGAIDVTFSGFAPHVAPRPVPMVVSTLLRLPEAWFLGALGGGLSRWVRHGRQSPAAS